MENILNFYPNAQ